jgi:vacuolar-type H+-ATPase subunit H
LTRKKKRKMRQSSRSISAKAERQARAEGQRIMESYRPRLEREYRRRVARDGKASAERWLKKESFVIGARVGRQMKEKYAGQ